MSCRWLRPPCVRTMPLPMGAGLPPPRLPGPFAPPLPPPRLGGIARAQCDTPANGRGRAHLLMLRMHSAPRRRTPAFYHHSPGLQQSRGSTATASNTPWAGRGQETYMSPTQPARTTSPFSPTHGGPLRKAARSRGRSSSPGGQSRTCFTGEGRKQL